MQITDFKSGDKLPFTSVAQAGQKSVVGGSFGDLQEALNVAANGGRRCGRPSGGRGLRWQHLRRRRPQPWKRLQRRDRSGDQARRRDQSGRAGKHQLCCMKLRSRNRTGLSLVRKPLRPLAAEDGGAQRSSSSPPGTSRGGLFRFRPLPVVPRGDFTAGHLWTAALGGFLVALVVAAFLKDLAASRDPPSGG